MSEIIQSSWTINPNEAFYNGPKGNNFYIADTKSNSRELQEDLNLLNNSPIPVGAYVMISYRGTEDTASYQSNKSTDGINLNSSIWQKQILNTSEIADYENHDIRILQAASTTSPKWCYVFITSSQGEVGDSINIIDTFNVDTTTSYNKPNNGGTTTEKKLDKIGFEDFESQDALDVFLREVFEYYYKASENYKEFNNLNDTVIGNFYLYKTYNTNEILQKIYMSVYYICNNKTAQTYFISKISGYYTPPKELTSINGFEYNERTGSLRLGNYNNTTTPLDKQIIIGDNTNLLYEGAITIGSEIKPNANTIFALNAELSNDKNTLEIQKNYDEQQNAIYSLLLNGETIADTSNSLNKLQQQIYSIMNTPMVKPYFNTQGQRLYYDTNQDKRSFISLNGQIQSVNQKHWEEFFSSEIPTRIKIITPLASKYTHLALYSKNQETYIVENLIDTDEEEEALPSNNNNNSFYSKMINKDYYQNDVFELFIGYRTDDDIYTDTTAKENETPKEYKAYEWINRAININSLSVQEVAVKQRASTNSNDPTSAQTANEDETIIYATPQPSSTTEGKEGEYYFTTEYEITKLQTDSSSGTLIFAKQENCDILYKIIQVYGILDSFNEKTVYSLSPKHLSANTQDTDTVISRYGNSNNIVYLKIDNAYLEKINKLILLNNDKYEVYTPYGSYAGKNKNNTVEHFFTEQHYSLSSWNLISWFINSGEKIRNYLNTHWSIGQFRTFSGLKGDGAIIAGKRVDYYYTDGTNNNNDLNADGNNIIMDPSKYPNNPPIAEFTFMLGNIQDNIFYTGPKSSSPSSMWNVRDYKNPSKTDKLNLLNVNYLGQDYYDLKLFNIKYRTLETDGPLNQIGSLIKRVMKKTNNRDPEGNLIISIHRVFIPSADEVPSSQSYINSVNSGTYDLFTTSMDNVKFANYTQSDTKNFMFQLRNPYYNQAKKTSSWLFYIPKEKAVIIGPTTKEELINNAYTTRSEDSDEYYYTLGTTLNAKYGLRMFCL